MPKRTVFIIASGVILLFALFCVSVAILGSWWHFPNMPTPEEWSAFFGASALVALAFAWYQLRQVDQSNRELVASNDATRRLAAEQIRPRVRVYLDVVRIATKKRGDPARGSIYVTVRNFGPTPATNVKLTLDTHFVSLDHFFKPGMMQNHLDEMSSVFDGSSRFDTLLPEKEYVWFLGLAPDLLDDTTLATRQYRIRAEYSATATDDSYDEEYLLDRDVERNVAQPVDPLERIGKDIEVLADKLQGITAKL